MEFHGNTVLIRMVEALAFRYRWATEGLREDDLSFQPAEDCMSLRNFLIHELQLAWFIGNAFGVKFPEPEFDPQSCGVEAIRELMLERLKAVKAKLAALTDEDLGELQFHHGGSDYPIWIIINGPLADALSHIGQINSWRRLNGNPWPGANVFLMEPEEI